MLHCILPEPNSIAISNRRSTPGGEGRWGATTRQACLNPFLMPETMTIDDHSTEDSVRLLFWDVLVPVVVPRTKLELLYYSAKRCFSQS